MLQSLMSGSSGLAIRWFCGHFQRYLAYGHGERHGAVQLHPAPARSVRQ